MRKSILVYLFSFLVINTFIFFLIWFGECIYYFDIVSFQEYVKNIREMKGHERLILFIFIQLISLISLAVVSVTIDRKLS
jgi:hypothetical protein